MSILKVSDLKKSYDKGNTFAVNGISFEVEPQDIVGLLGPNGAGKSTVLRLLTGVIKPDSGMEKEYGVSSAGTCDLS